jgi:acetyl-CoA carboxylase biotin carboxyl carrier protein
MDFFMINKIEDLQALLRALNEEGVSNFQLETEGKKFSIGWDRGTPVVTATVARPEPTQIVAAAPVESQAQIALPPSPAPVEEVLVEEDLVELTAIMPGVFYAKPSPDEPDFVKVGDAIEVGQTLCLVEAMKLYNPIESEESGVIVSIEVSDGQAIEYGQTLFKIRP